jgi:hypothetical protein
MAAHQAHTSKIQLHTRRTPAKYGRAPIDEILKKITENRELYSRQGFGMPKIH